jgi:hypothetical protein
VDATTVLPYFQIAGQLAIVLGAVFALYQLWSLERNRKEQSDLQLLTSFNNNEFRDAFARIYDLPLSATPEDVRRAGPDVEGAATTVLMTFEMLGVLVYNRHVSIQTLDEAIGGFLRESWRRLEPYVRWKRTQVESSRYGEWYQWLYEHSPTNKGREKGAYEVFRDWKA